MIYIYEIYVPVFIYLPCEINCFFFISKIYCIYARLSTINTHIHIHIQYIHTHTYMREYLYIIEINFTCLHIKLFYEGVNFWKLYFLYNISKMNMKKIRAWIKEVKKRKKKLAIVLCWLYFLM